MNLTLERVIFTPDTTSGILLTNGQFECFTLEDVARAEGVKVYGKTAIPYGSYDVVLRFSPSHGRVMPYLENVPMFTDVMMHIGNDKEDTLGCILVGRALRKDRVEESTLAFNVLFPKIAAAIQEGQRVVLNIYSDPPAYHL